MKKIASGIVLLAAAALMFSQEQPGGMADNRRFRIIYVDYNITGATQEYALALNVPVDTDRIFSSEDELRAYIADIEQQVINQRVIETAEASYSFLEPGSAIGLGVNDKDIVPVVLKIKTSDTHNLIIVPYPKYNSNSGLDLRFKLKNYNFLGLMQTLTGDLIYKYDEDGQHSAGGAISIDLPFKTGIFDMKWLNDYSILYTFGKSKPEFSAMTGIEATLPFKAFSIVFTAKQRANLDFEYTDAGDEIYFTEEGSIAVPIEIADIGSWAKVKLTPDAHVKYYWDKNGITHEDLLSPIVGTGYKLTASRINWVGNYRNGFSFEFGQKFDYNYHPDKKAFIPSIWGELQVFRAFKYLSFSTRLYLFGKDNGTEEISGRLRGIRDEQDGSETTLAFVGNFEMPVKIFQTDWIGWFRALSKKEPASFWAWLDFELQVSPFIDIALSHINFRKVKNPRAVLKANLGMDTGEIVMQTIEGIIAKNDGATLEQINDELIIKGLELGFLDLLKKEYTDLTPLLLDRFDYEPNSEKYTIKKNTKFQTHIDVRLRIKYYLISFLRRAERENKIPSFDEIVLAILPLLKNGVTPEHQTILGVLEDIGVQVGADGWRLKAAEKTLFDGL
ncbi:MAG: hypothetical protein Pg6C_19930 [Treponemataceae bacterium]|nr:MAG: hypothetical protein Pg6C_19930 [Treponemataceae bacterium]